MLQASLPIVAEGTPSALKSGDPPEILSSSCWENGSDSETATMKRGGATTVTHGRLTGAEYKRYLPALTVARSYSRLLTAASSCSPYGSPEATAQKVRGRRHTESRSAIPLPRESLASGSTRPVVHRLREREKAVRVCPAHALSRLVYFSFVCWRMVTETIVSLLSSFSTPLRKSVPPARRAPPVALSEVPF